jgi:hypothetical protein
MSDVAELTSVDEEVLVVIVSFLTAEELTNMGRTGKEYGWKRRGKNMSLANYVAMKVFGTANKVEPHVLPPYKGESQIARLRQLYLLHGPLEFTLVGSMFSFAERALVSKTMIRMESENDNLALISCVMRGGRHWVTFVITNDYNDYLGTLGGCRPLPGWENRRFFALVPLPRRT